MLCCHGRAPDEDEPGKASELLRSTWGVRLVDNRVACSNGAENYIWAASRRGQRIRLTGYAPSVATRQVIIGVARANFPGFEIVDRTRLARGVPPHDTWLAGISFALRQLTSLKRGDVRLDGLNMTVTGEAEDLNEYRSVKNRAGRRAAQGHQAHQQSCRAPSVSPHTWSAQLEGGQMMLSGHAPDEGRGIATASPHQEHGTRVARSTIACSRPAVPPQAGAGRRPPACASFSRSRTAAPN